MTEEITVVRIEEEKPLSFEEREVLFNSIAAKMKLPPFFMDNFAIMEDEDIANDLKSLHSDIASLTLRKVLEFPCVLPVANVDSKDRAKIGGKVKNGKVKKVKEAKKVKEVKNGKVKKVKEAKKIKEAKNGKIKKVKEVKEVKKKLHHQQLPFHSLIPRGN